MKILQYIKKEKNILLLAIFIGTFITIIFTSITKGYAYNIQKGISDEVFRLHVLANSDTLDDQALKIAVKNEIINTLESELRGSKSKDETRAMLISNFEKIKNVAKKVIKKMGYNYDVSVKISYENFPTKEYGDIVLPAGEYEALKVNIGEAKGKNWWCVMFPPLCFVDGSVNIVPKKDKDILENVLTKDEYDIISKSKQKDNISLKIKFKIIELFQNAN